MLQDESCINLLGEKFQPEIANDDTLFRDSGKAETSLDFRVF
jgi:hypothetical protein